MKEDTSPEAVDDLIMDMERIALYSNRRRKIWEPEVNFSIDYPMYDYRCLKAME